MSDFKTRLIAERDDLKDRYEKLKTFIATPDFKSIDELQQILLEQQCLQMATLLLTLEQRLAAL